MLLLTGATGQVGSALLRRLTARGTPVRCLVRDPRRLGPERVRVQIALGDLADPASFRHALRGVHTVVHLAASERDQPRATIEELDGLATWRLLEAAAAAGVEHFVFFAPLGATAWHRSRVHRAKALAAEAVERAPLPTTTLRPSLVYAPGGGRLALLEALALLPVVPLTGLGRGVSQPIWADDVARCALAVVDRGPGESGRAAYDLAGPDTLSHRALTELVLRSVARPRPLLPVPLWALRPALRAYETLTGPAAFATWDEADFSAVSMIAAHGTRDAGLLGVSPHPVAKVLGVEL